MIETRSGLHILLFANQTALERWLAAQPRDSKGAWFKFAKKGATTISVTKAEAIDAALCHGWIDGQLDKYDDQFWLIRFTPRKTRSKWSEVNRTRALQLAEAGRVQPSGQAEIDKAKQDGRWDDAYAPQSSAQVPPDLQAALDVNPAAAEFFASLAGANRYAILYRIGAVKKADTRARKIADFVAMLESQETLH